MSDEDGGIGDDTSDSVAENRRLRFDLAPAGERYLLWNLDEAARHATFDFDPSACGTYGQNEGLDPALYPQRCADYVTWQRSTALSFADAQLRNRPEATAYLAVLYQAPSSASRPSDALGGGAPPTRNGPWGPAVARSLRTSSRGASSSCPFHAGRAARTQT